jgi:hypothetical protein
LDGFEDRKFVVRTRFAFYADAVSGESDRYRIGFAFIGSVEPVGEPERLGLNVGDRFTPERHDVQPRLGRISDTMQVGRVHPQNSP